jgi:hypothetical protein
MSHEQHDNDLSRRTFMKAAGAATGASLFGVGTAAGASTTGSVDTIFRNIRVREALKAWERGYRGRADRALALTDSGVEGRHPDLGPWNGVTATTTEDGLVLSDTEVETTEVEIYETTARQEYEYTGTAAGGEYLGIRPFVHGPFSVAPAEFDTSSHDEVRIKTVLTWEPSNPEGTELAAFDLRVMKNGEQLASTGYETILGGGNDDNRKELVVNDGVELDAADEYELWVYGYRAPAVYEIDVDVEEVHTDQVVGTETRTVAETTPLSDADLSDRLPDEGEVPQLVAWHNDDTTSGDFHRPRDSNGHGTHVSGIMTGTGRASALDPESVETADPSAVLFAGDVLPYEVTATAEGGVFGAVVGDGIEVVIEGPEGRTLATSVGAQGSPEVSLEANIAQAPTVHGSGTAPYTVYVRPATGEAAVPASVDSLAVGAFESYDETAGDALEPGASDDGLPQADSLHAGVAPGCSLVGVTGLGGGASNVARAAADFASDLGVRAVNMSWGPRGGVPIGMVEGGIDTTPGDVADITDGGILVVAAAGNAATPANGNGSPAVVEEAVSVVATGPRDGIASYSSGGIGGVDEDGSVHGKPDVTAPGGIVNQLDWAAQAGDPGSDETFGDVRDFTGKGGTSMASPSVCGIAGLVAQAMEEDAPEEIALPEPTETGREDVLRLKQTILATASETAFTAAPYHRGKAPSYTFGERDPYEGYGRANVDAAIDAVTETLLDGVGMGPGETASASLSGEVGLDVPEDARAAAGHVVVPDGSLDVSLSVDRLAGSDRGLARGDPHLDLFVYDAETPAEDGDPNVVARAQATDGAADLSLDVSTDEGEGSRVYYVVAKLVDVPGAVNGDDVQVQFDVDLEFEAAPLPPFTAGGSRADDGTAFTAGHTDNIRVTVDDVGGVRMGDLHLFDVIPRNWGVRDGATDTPYPISDTHKRVPLGPISGNEIEATGEVTRDYYVRVPEETGEHELGPAEVELRDPYEHGYRPDEESSFAVAEVGGTDTNVVVGVDQNDPAGSATGSAEDAADDGVDTVGDTVNEHL